MSCKCWLLVCDDRGASEGAIKLEATSSRQVIDYLPQAAIRSAAVRQNAVIDVPVQPTGNASNRNGYV